MNISIYDIMFSDIFHTIFLFQTGETTQRNTIIINIQRIIILLLIGYGKINNPFLARK